MTFSTLLASTLEALPVKAGIQRQPTLSQWPWVPACAEATRKSSRVVLTPNA